MGQVFSPGQYRGVVREIVPSVTKTNKSPQVSIKVEIQWRWNAQTQSWDGVDAEDRWIFLSMSGGAVDYTMRKLDAIGFNGDFSNPMASNEAMNEGIDLQCFHETYQGRTREKFEIPMGDYEPTPLDAVAIRQLNEQWRQRNGGTAAAAQPKPRPKPAGPPPASPPTAPLESEVPF